MRPRAIKNSGMLIKMRAIVPVQSSNSARQHCLRTVFDRTLSLGLVGLAAVSCGTDNDPELPPVWAQLPRVQYRSDTDLSLCPEAPELVQQRIEVLESTLGVQGPPQITYVHTSTRAEALRLGNCTPSARACTRGSEIFAPSYVYDHEIVHAVMSATGHPNSVVIEGVAAAFGYSDDPGIYPLKAWRDLVSVPNDDPNYVFAVSYGGLLVTRLFDDYGPNKLVSLYKNSPEGLAPDEFAARFEQIYGTTLDDTWASLLTMKYGVVCVDLSDNTDLSGAENNAVPHCPGEIVPARHVWTLDADTPLAIETTYRQALLGSCDPSIVPTDGQVLYNYAAGAPILSLARWHKGTYYATPSRVDGTESFRMWTGPWLGPNCADITPYQLPTAPARFSLGLPDQQWLALEWHGDAPLTYLAGLNTGYDNSTWYKCSACDRMQCQRLGDWEPLTIGPGITWFFAERGTDVQTEDTWLYVEASN